MCEPYCDDGETDETDRQTDKQADGYQTDCTNTLIAMCAVDVTLRNDFFSLINVLLSFCSRK